MWVQLEASLSHAIQAFVRDSNGFHAHHQCDSDANQEKPIVKARSTALLKHSDEKGEGYRTMHESTGSTVLLETPVAGP